MEYNLGYFYVVKEAACGYKIHFEVNELYGEISWYFFLFDSYQFHYKLKLCSIFSFMVLQL